MQKRYYSELKFENKDIFLKQYLMKGGTYQFCWHKAIELMLVLKGEIEVYVEGELNTLQEEDVLWINSNLGHSIFSKDVDSITLILEISPEFLKESFQNYDDLQVNCVSTNITRYNSIFSQIRFYMAKIICYAMNSTYMDITSEKAFASVLISEIIQNFAIEKSGDCINKGLSGDITGIKKAMDYIEENYQNKISLEEVSSVAGYNRTYLSTLFKKKLGITFNEYVMRVRLKNAVGCLSNLEMPVLEIALNNGFADSKTFVQYMKKYCGKTPERYRAELRNHPDMGCLYGENLYLLYPNLEAERKINYFKEDYFYNANHQKMTLNKEEVVKEVSNHCREILEVVNKMF